MVSSLALASLGSTGLSQTDLRGWHACGQTWLVWEDAPGATSTSIYVSDAPILEVGAADKVAQVFREDSRGARLQLFDRRLRWTVPASSSGRRTLTEEESLFAYTPKAARPEYFAVLHEGETALAASRRAGPIVQTLDPVECHLQREGSENGYRYRIYAHWIDGRRDRDSGRPDDAVMGNEHANGVGFPFVVWEPRGGRAPGSTPAVVWLHGGRGSFAQGRPYELAPFGLDDVDALTVAFDDPLWIRRSAQSVEPRKTYWYGYWEGYNRFLTPEMQPLPDNALIVNYTMRRVDWCVGWLIENESIDPKRVSMLGSSMGGRGAGYNTRLHPERYAAALLINPGTRPHDSDILLGARARGLRTNLPGSPTVAETFDYSIPIASNERDMVFTKVVVGRGDRSIGAAWSPQRVQQLNDLDRAGFGHHLYWDGRAHGRNSWAGAHWHGSPRLRASALTRYRSDQSFPAFLNDDQAPETAGRQPHPGEGDRGDGDPWGTWGGYHDWDSRTIEDTPCRWEATVFLVSSSPFPSDVPSFDASRADVAIRRPQKFKPTAGAVLDWTLTRVSEGKLLQSGTVAVPAGGLVLVRGLMIHKDPSRLQIVRR